MFERKDLSLVQTCLRYDKPCSKLAVTRRIHIMKTPRFTLSAVAFGLFAASAGLAHAECEIVDGLITGKSKGGTWNTDCLAAQTAQASRQAAADARAAVQAQQQSAPAAIDAAPVQQSGAPAPSAQPRPQQSAPAASASPPAGGNPNLPPQLPPGFPSGGGSSDGNPHARRAKKVFWTTFGVVLFPNGGNPHLWYLGPKIGAFGRIGDGWDTTAALQAGLEFRVRPTRALNIWLVTEFMYQHPLGSISDQLSDLAQRASAGERIPAADIIKLGQQSNQAREDLTFGIGPQVRVGCWANLCKGVWKGLSLGAIYHVNLLHSADREQELEARVGMMLQFRRLKFEPTVGFHLPLAGIEKNVFDAFSHPLEVSKISVNTAFLF